MGAQKAKMMMKVNRRYKMHSNLLIKTDMLLPRNSFALTDAKSE